MQEEDAPGRDGKRKTKPGAKSLGFSKIIIDKWNGMV
jgi:hypothetical protein